MPVKDLIIDVGALDLTNILADADAIRECNPQRFEMEQLTAIVFEDMEALVCAGYKDVGEDEFWVRGHMPGMPLMPGVIICEAAAQLSGYFAIKHDMLGTRLVGFGGLTDVHFRGMVRPGDRLVIAIHRLKLRRGAMIVCRFQAFVENEFVCDGVIKGVPLPEVPAVM